MDLRRPDAAPLLRANAFPAHSREEPSEPECRDGPHAGEHIHRRRDGPHGPPVDLDPGCVRRDGRRLRALSRSDRDGALHVRHVDAQLRARSRHQRANRRRLCSLERGASGRRRVVSDAHLHLAAAALSFHQIILDPPEGHFQGGGRRPEPKRHAGRKARHCAQQHVARPVHDRSTGTADPRQREVSHHLPFARRASA